MESASISVKTETFKTITSDNLAAAQEHLGKLTWGGDYKRALPLADKIFAFRSEQGDRDAALLSYASSYYSVASRLWSERGIKASVDVGKYMNTALRSLQERIEHEIQRQGGRKEGMIPVPLEGMSANECDVMQAVYQKAGEMADKGVDKIAGHLPFVRSLRQRLPKDWNPIRDFDAAALVAIRAGLKRIAKEADHEPHTNIFLKSGAFAIAHRYEWEERATARAQELFELAETFPWPTEDVVSGGTKTQSTYGQAARVARHLRDVANAMGETERAAEFQKKAEMYATHVADQQAKL